MALSNSLLSDANWTLTNILTSVSDRTIQHTNGSMTGIMTDGYESVSTMGLRNQYNLTDTRGGHIVYSNDFYVLDHSGNFLDFPLK